MELPDLLPQNAIMAEIGVFRGESTEQFLSVQKVRLLIAVDAWIAAYDDNDLASSCTVNEMRDAELRFRKRFGWRPDVAIIKALSVDAAALFADRTFDLVYLDANHTYDFVRDDIAIWSRKIKEGGILSGHDYCPAHADVMRAVNEKFNSPIQTFADDSWMVFIE